MKLRTFFEAYYSFTWKFLGHHLPMPYFSSFLICFATFGIGIVSFFYLIFLVLELSPADYYVNDMPLNVALWIGSSGIALAIVTFMLWLFTWSNQAYREITEKPYDYYRSWLIPTFITQGACIFFSLEALLYLIDYLFEQSYS